MNISDRTVITLIFILSIVVPAFYWFIVSDFIGTIVCFLFICSVAILMMLNSIKVNHPKVSGIMRRFGLLPNPTESSMLVLALATLAFISINGLWIKLIEFAKSDFRALFLLLYLFFGMFLCFYHAFSTHKKNKFEQESLRFYLVITLISLSLYTALYVFESKQVGYLVFVVWNLLQAFALYTIARFLPNEYIALPQREVKLKESIFAVLVVALGVGIGHYLLHQHWAVIFSSIILIWNLLQQFFMQKTYSVQF